MGRYQLNREMAGRTMAVLLSLVLILSSSGITALAAEIPETSADFVGEEEQDTSNEVLGEGMLFDADMPREGAEEQTLWNNEDIVSSEQDLEEAAAESMTEEVVGTSSRSTSDVSYIECSWDGTKVVSETKTGNAVEVSSDGSMTSGWYYLSSDVTVDGRIESITGDVNLILGDGCTLDVRGLYIPNGSTLTIYAQSDGENAGRLCSHPSGGAGIGGYSGHDNGNIVIHGGAIEATGADHCAGIGSNDGHTGGVITIYGGTVTATGGSNGAGIGGGRESDAGIITIYGGSVTATGKNDSAGIGGGDSDNSSHGNASNITIHGGTVTATSSGAGAGIGGADYGTAHVMILGGTVSAQSTGNGRGIGGGSKKTPDESTVTLGYTDATRGSISITASSFGGTVTLEMPFGKYTGNAGQYLSNIFMPGVVTDNSLLTGGTLRSCDFEINSWQTLQTAINSASSGATLQLGADISAIYTVDDALTVGSDKSITIDLNGHTINRALTGQDAAENGYVILNDGTLTITDTAGGGAITGGNSSGAGGGIYNSGTLTITSGTITGNAADTWGGGIYLPNGTGAVLHLNGGSITGNTCANNGGGVHVSGSASITISGSPVVSGNTKNGAANNIYLAGSTVMQVTDPLTEGANLGVSASGGTAVITSGYSTQNGTTDPETFLHADNENYMILPETGEAKIDAGLTNIAYQRLSWNGSAVAAETAAAAKARPVPEDGGMTDGWYYLNSNVTVNGRVCLTGNTNLILGDGFTLDVKGIHIPQGSTLTIYAQSSGENAGRIISKPSGGAGIGAYSGHPGGSVVIHGGVIEAKGADHCAGIGSNDGNGTTAPITIYGGSITAKGGSDGAGIGGGRDCDGGTITIYGGDITAKGGGENGAGIGGGDDADGGTITIYGGTITANEDPNEDGAGIGGGDAGDGGTITIHGGTITTYSRDGAGIGGGDDGDGGKITIHGGTIKCWDSGYAQGARIGGGSDGDGGIITITGGTIDVYFRDGAGIGGGEDADGGIIRISGGTIETHPMGKGNAAGIGGGNQEGTGGNITVTGGNIRAVSTHGAGIGGGRATKHYAQIYSSGNGGTIVISGGEVYASSASSFGIGAGGALAETTSSSYVPSSARIGSAGKITIQGTAHVTARGVYGGIGGDGGTLSITGGTVDVMGWNGKDNYLSAYNGAGILLLTGNVTISGGTVNATGYGPAPGIAVLASSNTVSITGGTVKAFSERASAIGGWNYKGGDYVAKHSYGKLVISGPNTVIEAESGSVAALGYTSKGNIICQPANTGLRYTAGAAKDSAQTLQAEDREGVYKNNNYKYVRIEPCDHVDTIEEDMCWACGWKAGSYYVTYELDPDEILSVDMIEHGGKAQRPEDPARAGAVFVNWYQVLADGTLAAEPYTFDVILTEDITLRAAWIHEHDGLTFENWDDDDSLPTQAGSYCLTGDVTLAGGWTWSGGTLDLCLNGHTITANQINDPVITIAGGTLDLYDEAGGAITQFDGRDATVRINAGGTLNMHGGTVTGATNAYADPFAGVEVYGTFHMSGGSVTGNPKGVLVDGGTFTVSGSACVTGNARNVILFNNEKIEIGGTLSSDARIGVTADADVFTSGLSGKGDASNFFSDDNHYVVTLEEEGSSSGEAKLEVAYMVTYEPGDENAEGDMARIKVGRWLTLPACSYSVRGKTFTAWSVRIGDNEPVNGQPDSRIEVNADTTVTAVWETLSVTTISGVSGSFNDRIKLNYYFDFPEAVLEDEAAYVTLTNESSGKGVTLLVKDAEFVDGKGYKFSIPLAAKEANDTITARVYDGGNNALPITGNLRGNDYTESGVQYSLMQYFDWLKDSGTTDKEKAVGAAAKDYCAAAQIYFGYNSDGVSVSSAVDAVTSDTLSGFAAGRSGTLPGGVSINGISAMLESDNTLRLYLGFKDGDTSGYTFAIDGNETDIRQRRDGSYYLALGTGVYSDHLQDTYTYTVSDGTNTYTITASVMTYARSCAIKDDETVSNLGKALYLYNKAAVAAFGE